MSQKARSNDTIYRLIYTGETFPLAAVAKILTLNQPGSGKDVKYPGLFCFDLAFTRCKLTSPGICVVCHRTLRFRKSAQNGAAPAIQ